MKRFALTAVAAAALGITAAQAEITAPAAVPTFAYNQAQAHALFQARQEQMEKQQAWIQAQMEAQIKHAEARMKAMNTYGPQFIGMPTPPEMPKTPAFGQSLAKEDMEAMIQAQRKIMEEQRAQAEARMKAWQAQRPQMPEFQGPGFNRPPMDQEAMKAEMEKRIAAAKAEMESRKAQMQKQIEAMKASMFKAPAFTAPQMPAERQARVEAMQEMAKAQQARVDAYWRNVAAQQRAAWEQQAKAFRGYYGG